MTIPANRDTRDRQTTRPFDYTVTELAIIFAVGAIMAAGAVMVLVGFTQVESSPRLKPGDS